MSHRHEDLYWLVAPPQDFRAQCKAIDAQLQADDRTQKLGVAIQKLAATRLNTNQLTSLSGLIQRAQQSGADLAPLSAFKLGVLGNATTCLYVPTIAATAARYGVSLSIHQAEYDQVMHEALDPQSGINTSAPDAVLLALDYHALPFGGGMPSGAAIDYVETIREGLERGCRAPVILQTVPVPPTPLFGSLDVSADVTLRRQVTDFNAALVAMAQKRGDYVLDIAALAEMVGTQNWQDPAQWNLYKLPFAQSMVPIYAEHVARVIGAIRGTSRKCLVLDLDNTLWGGVIGDDGLTGIRIGQGDGIAEAHTEVQKMALALRERGIVLAVCSKNDDAVARQPFRELPDMILREDHIAVFQANWRDKASNLEAIAKTLNIGLDALVFMDDNPAEREQVRAVLPMVAVPELPDDVSYYARTILNAGYFEAVNFSEEDKKRAQQYQENARRAELESTARNMDEFLDSLQMKIEMAPVTPISVVRVTQLINKTNQFNLTTKRYTQAEVEAMMTNPDVIMIQVRLEDRFGDNGIISLGIGIVQDGVCAIDTWLMSCRVLGRRVEEMLLVEFVKQAKQRGAHELRGRYSPSEKNSMVAEHYKKLGFALVSDQNGETLWALSVQSFEEPALPFERMAA